MTSPTKTLYRSRSNRMIGGVAAGLGEYLNIDPTVVRLLFVFAALVGWVAPAVIVYLVMMFVVPEAPLATASSPRPARSESVVVESEPLVIDVEPVVTETAGGASAYEPPSSGETPGAA
jgi:phage shock protein C